jgi:hypothetical protein
MSTLLEQAIIDAEALREAAMKNAEASIVEKYSSEVKAAVESLLSEEFEEELGGEEEESDESPVMDEVPYAAEDDNGEPITVRLDLEALERALEEEGSDEAEETHADLASEVLDENFDEPSEEEDEEEVELDETLLAAIAEELRVDVGMPGQGMGGRTTPTSADLEGQEATLANLKDDELAEEHEAFQKAKEEADMYLEQVKKLTASNKKLQTTLTTLNERMEDVNLSNARLLYTNRVLKSNSLNERQRTRIVESISTAGSVEEAKVIYETLQSAVGGTKRAPQSLSEAVDRSSPTLPRNSSRATKQPNAQNPQYNRMKALAGIKGDN